MFVLLIAVILISGVGYLISKLRLNKVWESRVLVFFKQGTTTLVMFNIYNIGYSMGVHIRYGGWNIGSSEYTLSTVVMSFALLACIIFILALELADPAQYG